MVENLRPEANFCRQVREAAEEAYFIQNKDEISKRLRVGDRAVLLAFAWPVSVDFLTFLFPILPHPLLYISEICLVYDIYAFE